MKIKTSLLLLTLTTALGLSGPVLAKKLPDAEEVDCDFANGMVTCAWNNGVMGAGAYKWEVTAEYDVDYNDDVVDRKKKFHFETAGPNMENSPSDMKSNFYDADGRIVPDKMPMSAKVRVKAAGLAKGRKGKNSPYSEMCEVSFEETCKWWYELPDGTRICRGL